MASDVVLVAEDDDILRAFIVDGLRKRGFVAFEAADGQAALDQSDVRKIDVYVLDRNLPAIDGLKLLRILRAKGIQEPVVFLTAISGVAERIRGLELGADDYVTKPFDIDELSARIKALLRRPAVVVSDVLIAGDLTFDTSNSRVCFRDSEIDMTAQDKDLLALFLRKPSQIFSREMLLDRLDMGADVTPAAVEHAISRLRRKLTAFGISGIIETVRGIGYRLKRLE